MTRDCKKMFEQYALTVLELKERLKARGLLTTSAKAELILRLQEANLTGSWMESGNVEDGRDEARESTS